jgi:hypothetical protein
MTLQTRDSSGNLVDLPSDKLASLQAGLGLGAAVQQPTFVSFVAANDLSGHRAVLVTSARNIDYASADTLSHSLRVIGVTLNAGLQGASIDVANGQEIIEPSWNWDVNLPVFLGLNGALTQVVPTYPTSVFSLMIGMPTSTTSIFVSIGSPISLA